jgi:xanthosine utilization system XapX-like protein
MTMSWGALLSIAGAFVFGAVASTLNEEVRGRLDRLPRALIRLAGRRLPQTVRDDLTDEWAAELDAILQRAEALPLTRLLVGIRYALGLLRVAPVVASELTGVPSTSMPRAAWLYIGGVVASAGILIGTSSFEVSWPRLGVLVLLFVACDSITTSGRVSQCISANLAAVILLGPPGAALVGLSAVITGHRSLSPVKRVFNGAQFAVCGYAAGQVYLLFGQHPGLPKADHVSELLGPGLAALMTYLTLNLLLIGGILVVTKQATLRTLQWRPISQVAAGHFGYGMFGLPIAMLWRPAGPFAGLLLMLPLAIAGWAFARVRSAAGSDRHQGPRPRRRS